MLYCIFSFHLLVLIFEFALVLIPNIAFEKKSKNLIEMVKKYEQK